MPAFWSDLSLARQVFLVMALFFSLIFVWQMIAALIGLTADVDADVDADGSSAGDGSVDDHMGAGSVIDFKLISVRSIIAFMLLFSWAAFLFLAKEGQVGFSYTKIMIYSFLWGVAAMVLVSWLFYQLLKMQESGTAKIHTALNTEGEVYMDIPEKKSGQIRVLVSGRVSFINARTDSGEPLKAGTKIVVSKILDANNVVVRKL